MQIRFIRISGKVPLGRGSNTAGQGDILRQFRTECEGLDVYRPIWPSTEIEVEPYIYIYEKIYIDMLREDTS